MFKQFSRNEKFFLLHDAVFLIPLSIIGIFVNFFIWDKTNSLSSIALFQIFCGIGILIGAFLSTFLLNRAAPNTVRAAGVILTAVSIGIISLLNPETSSSLVLSGFVFGFDIGLRAQAYKLLFTKAIEVHSREKFLTLDKLFSSIISIVVPFIAAYTVSKTGDYTGIFVLMIIFLVVSVVPLLFISGLNVAVTRLAFGEVLDEIKREKDLKKTLTAKFFEGIQIGIDNSVWSIIVLSIVGSLQGWGLFNTIFAALAAIVSYTIGKKIKFSNSKFVFAIMAVILTVVGLLFASNFNFASYILFSFVSGIATNLFDTAFQSIENKIKDRKISDSNSLDEYNLIEEVPVFAGKMIPFLVVFIFNPTFENDLLLRLFVAVISIIPLLIFSILSDVVVVRKSDDPFIEG